MKDELFYSLTERQQQIGYLIHKGYSTKDIAGELGIAYNTVKDHRKNLFAALGVIKDTELAGLSIWDDNMEKISTFFTRTISSTIYELTGIWLSKFMVDMYRHESFIPGRQFNLEKIESQLKKSTYAGKNLLCRSSTKNAFFHKLECEVFGNIVIGKWFNTNTNNCGCYQLYIHNNGNMMFGKHLGNASNNKIMPGDWIWIRVEVQETEYEKEDFLQGKQFISFKKLDEKFKKFIEDGFAIDYNCIIE
jgi:DNA-binding CsgD family transcriptional regulator